LFQATINATRFAIRETTVDEPRRHSLLPGSIGIGKRF
jgi:hypothetical protein